MVTHASVKPYQVCSIAAIVDITFDVRLLSILAAAHHLLVSPDRTWIFAGVDLNRNWGFAWKQVGFPKQLKQLECLQSGFQKHALLATWQSQAQNRTIMGPAIPAFTFWRLDHVSSPDPHCCIM